MLGDNFPQFADEFNNEERYTPKELAEKAIKIDSYENIKKAINRYGLEGTEDKIKELYSNPKTREYLLKTLYFIWGK